MRVQDFKKLNVWTSSVDLSELIYRATASFPSAERFGLVSQMRASSVSISSNIAEGAGRRGGADTARFVQIAIGSVCELESQVLVAERLGLFQPSEALLDQVDKVRRQLIRLMASIEPPRNS